MKKFRILFLTGLAIVTFPVSLMILAYAWNSGVEYVKDSRNKDEIFYDTVEVKKTIIDTVRIKIYEKIPQQDTKKVETQPVLPKDTLK